MAGVRDWEAGTAEEAHTFEVQAARNRPHYLETELHSADLEYGRAWQEAAEWPWLDAVTWIATRNRTDDSDDRNLSGPRMMALVRGFRRACKREGSGTEYVVSGMLGSHIDRLEASEAARALFDALCDGRIRVDGLSCDDWRRHRVPVVRGYDGTDLPDVLIPSAALLDLWPLVDHPAPKLTAKAESECLDWLRDKFADGAGPTNAVLWEEAKDTWPALSKRAFDRAVAALSPVTRRRGGRPRKTSAL